ncbi:enoyl-CoA hydratase/isomerase family protein [Pseudomonas sp. UM16]|uniref:enoyl-CoA hydratase/isomerase family protein n=1 Tax=Pseudomonas sp. UM16 TaxID=3158962 RepID=UPI00398F9AB4
MMQPEALVLHRVEDGIGRLTLNRPEHGNALSVAFCQAWHDAVEQVIEARPRVVVLDANGPLFCAGGDIGEFVENRARLDAHIGAMLAILNPSMNRLANLSVPLLSVVHASLGGAGIAFACCADFVLASDTAKLRGGYSAIGLSPDLGASYYLSRRANATAAKRILMLNESLTAQACQALGLFDELYPAHELPAAAERLARRLAGSATGALGRIKRLCDGAAGHDIAPHLDLEAAALLACAQSADAAEGVQAFIDKRPAQFTGR